MSDAAEHADPVPERRVEPDVARARTSAGAARRSSIAVGSVHDAVEADADRLADIVVQRLAGGVTGSTVRPVVSSANPMAPGSRIRRSGTGDPAPLDTSAVEQFERIRRSGRPMPAPMRERTEAGFGADLSRVRLHTGPDADALNTRLGSRAFAVGDDIAFKGGLPDTARPAGQRLVAHEIAHTLQRSPTSRIVRRDGDDVPPKRADHEATLAGFVPTETLNKKFHDRLEKLKKKLIDEFGVNGMNIFRSREAREWRQGLKDAAREQARADVDAAVAANTTIQLDTERAYYAIEAKRKTYATAKDSLKVVLAKGVDDLLDEVWAGRQQAILDDAATKARDDAWDVLKQGPGSKDRIKEARSRAEKSALARLEVLYATAVASSHDIKRRIVNAEQNQAQQEPASLQGIDQQAKAQVTQDQVGQKALQHTIEADSVESGMGIFGKMLDQVVPTSGDQVSVAVEVLVPIAQGPGYVSFVLTGKAARGIDGAMTSGVPVFGDPRRLEVLVDLTFKAGLDLIGLDLNASVNFFVRGGGNDTALCMKSLQYGAYRAMGAISETAANWWAGAADGVEEGKAVRAESWAAMVEEQAFKKGGGFVDIGGGVGASGRANFEVKGNGVNLGLSGNVAGFRRYDHAALEESLGDQYAVPLDGATAAEKKQSAKDRRANVSGSSGGQWGVNADVTVAILGQKVTFAGSLSGPMGHRQFGLEVSATIAYSGSSPTALEQWGAGMASGIAEAVKTLIGLRKGALGGAFAASAEAMQIANARMDNAISEGLGSIWSVDGSKASMNVGATGTPDTVSGIGTSSTLQVAFLLGYDGDAVIARIEIRSGKKIEINAAVGGAGVKVSAEKTSRLFAAGYDKGGWNAEAFGVRARGSEDQRPKNGTLGKHHT